MRDVKLLLSCLLLLFVAACIGFLTWGCATTQEAVSRAPQSNADSQAIILNESYDATTGTLQAIGLSRGTLSPQANNLSPAQIWNYIYDPTCGCLQISLDDSSTDIPFTNLSGLVDGDLLKYDVTGDEWLNTAGGVTIDDTNQVGINSTTPARKLEIIDDTNPQVRLTQADASKYVDLQANSSGNLAITTTGTQVNIGGNQLYSNGYQTTVATKNKTNTYIADSVGNVLVFQPEYWTGSVFSANNSYCLGHLCLTSNNGANSNMIGYAAGNSNSGAYSNAVGYAALRFNMGTYANGVGGFSLQNNTGNFTNGMGGAALQFNSANNVNGIGYASLQYNTAAGANAIGSNALQYGTASNTNAVGYLSMRYATGATSNSLGASTLLYNQGTDNIAIGDSAWSTFLSNTGGNKTFDYTAINVSNDRVTVTGHGFGATNAWVNVLYTQGTGAITGLTNATVYQVKIIDANTLGFNESRGVDITAAGTGTGHTLTPQYAYNNSILIGADLVPTASNQTILGNASTTSAIIHGAVTLDAYTRSHTIPANAAVLGPTAPSLTSVGTYRGLDFGADAENVSLTFEVPNDWDGASNMTFKVYWTNEPADALIDTETVKWDMTYRVTDDTEDLDAGTVGSGTVTYTQAGAGTDGTLHESSITITYNDANQPLVADHVVGILFDRDVTADTYSGSPVVLQWEVDYTSVGIPKHD